MGKVHERVALYSGKEEWISIAYGVVYLNIFADIAGKLAKQALAQRGCWVGREGTIRGDHGEVLLQRRLLITSLG